MAIEFSSQQTLFLLKANTVFKKNIISIIKEEKEKLGEISYTFCNDRLLFNLNKRFLHHNTLTDIITFQYPEERISGEIFISIPRIKENAKKFNVSFDNELRRVIIHGILHLCGYKDKSKVDKIEMREMENYYLNKWEN